MKTTDRFDHGPLLTGAEKTLAVMLVAGLVGYWAGFNLAATDVGVPIPHASAAVTIAAPQPPHGAEPLSDATPERASGTPATASPRDDPPDPTF